MATPVSRDILNKETNARFWSQVGLRPGYKLDPKNPTDKAYIPVWKDIFKKVQAEANAGTLVTTYDHPDVAQGVSDAQVANTVAAVHVDAAAQAADPRDVQANTAAALTAARVAAQRLRDAVRQQPPTASPQLVQEAAAEAARTPPPPHAAADDQIAHAQTQAPTAQPDRRLIDETNARFWDRTNYKRGQKLDMSIAADRKMAKVWMEIFHEVQREAGAGGPPSELLDPYATPTMPPSSSFPSPGPSPTGPAPMQFPMPQFPMPRPPMWPRPQPSPGPRPGPRPPMGPLPPMGPQMGPQPIVSPADAPMPPMGPPEGAPGVPSGAPDVPTDFPPEVPAPASKKSSILKYVAIGVAVVAGGGLIYHVGTRRSSRSRSPRAAASFESSWAPRRS